MNWSALAGAFAVILSFLGSLSPLQHPSLSLNDRQPDVSSSYGQALAASTAAALPVAPTAVATATATDSGVSNAGTDQPSAQPAIASTPVITTTVIDQPGVSPSKFNALVNIVGQLATLIPASQQNQVAAINQAVAADGNPDVPYAAESNIGNLSNVVLNSPTINSPSISNLSTSQVSEGSNLYYTDGRVANYIESSSTIPNAAGALGYVLSWDGSRWAATATSSHRAVVRRV